MQENQSLTILSEESVNTLRDKVHELVKKVFEAVEIELNENTYTLQGKKVISAGASKLNIRKLKVETLRNISKLGDPK